MQIHHNPISMMLLRLSSMLVLIVALGACASQPAPAAPAAPAAPVADQTSAEADDHAEGEDYAHEGEAAATTEDHDHAEGEDHAHEAAATTDDHDHAEGEDHAHADEVAKTEDHAHDHDHEHSTAEEIAAKIALLTPIADGTTLKVVATTNIVGDVVANIGSDVIDLTTLMPVGADPHTFEATPQDIAVIAEADVVFVNGYNMEEVLMPLIEKSGIAAERIIPVSAGIEVLEFEGEHSHDDHEHEEDKQSNLLDLFTRTAAAHEGEAHDHDHGGVDPHTWMSPLNVKVWVENIEAVLVALDPAHEAQYEDNAARYIEELAALDEYIREATAAVPMTNRKLVTDHTVFGYFARDYEFRQVGAVFPSFSTLAEPSAKDIAALQTTIAEYNVPAIFVGTTVNPMLSERVAADAGVQLITIYTGSLSEAGGPADTYLNFMRFNTNQIVKGLAGA